MQTLTLSFFLLAFSPSDKAQERRGPKTQNHAATQTSAPAEISTRKISAPRLSVPAGPSAQESLSGRWGMLQVLGSRAEIPFVGDAVAKTRAVIVFDLVHDGDRLRGEGHLCHLDVLARPTLVRPVLPDTFRRALRKQSFSAQLKKSPSGMLLRGERQIGVVGAKLKNQAKDRLPTEPEQAFDTDGDGHPGITMLIEGLFEIEIYLAQRQWSELSGKQVSTDRFVGRVRHGAEQVLLGADSFLVQALPTMKPDLDASTFILQRLADDDGCLVAMRHLLPASEK